jgi:zinc transport system substrate-binding protein
MRKSKVFTIIMLIIVIFICNACIDNTQEQQTGKEQLAVAVSILPQADFVEHIGGDRVKVIVMIPPGASPATYEPTTSQLRSLSNAKLYVKLGSGLPFEEVWMDKIRSANTDMLIIDTSQGVDIIPKDPHIWLSPRSVMIQVENIYEGLYQIDPKEKEYYSRNKEQYLEELSDLDSRINESFMFSQNRSFMVFHPSWGYFARDYNLTMITVEIEGKEPSPSDLERLIKTAKENNIKVVLVQPQFSTRSAQVIANEIGGSIIPIDPLEKDYITNLYNVTSTIAQVLS